MLRPHPAPTQNRSASFFPLLDPAMAYSLRHLRFSHLPSRTTWHMDFKTTLSTGSLAFFCLHICWPLLVLGQLLVCFCGLLFCCACCGSNGLAAVSSAVICGSQPSFSLTVAGGSRAPICTITFSTCKNAESHEFRLQPLACSHWTCIENMHSSCCCIQHHAQIFQSCPCD